MRTFGAAILASSLMVSNAFAATDAAAPLAPGKPAGVKKAQADGQHAADRSGPRRRGGRHRAWSLPVAAAIRLRSTTTTTTTAPRRRKVMFRIRNWESRAALPFLCVQPGGRKISVSIDSALGMDVLAAAPDQTAVGVQPITVRERPFQIRAAAGLVHPHGRDAVAQNDDGLRAPARQRAGERDAISGNVGKILQPRAGERALERGGNVREAAGPFSASRRQVVPKPDGADDASVAGDDHDMRGRGPKLLAIRIGRQHQQLFWFRHSAR